MIADFKWKIDNAGFGGSIFLMHGCSEVASAHGSGGSFNIHINEFAEGFERGKTTMTYRVTVDVENEIEEIKKIIVDHMFRGKPIPEDVSGWPKNDAFDNQAHVDIGDVIAGGGGEIW